MRLQKYLADCGIASRRKAEELILQGKVTVNGEVIRELGTKVEDSDTVCFNGKKVHPVFNKYYIMLNKPEGYITTAKDEKKRKTVLELIDLKARLFPVGRLDAATTGLLLLTNDGDWANKITHPKSEIEKTYIARVSGVLSNENIKKIERGVVIDEKMTAPCRAELINSFGTSCEIVITIHEGRNRQVRKMMEAVGHKVIALSRVSVGNLTLGNLPVGKWRHLAEEEVTGIW